MPEAISSQESWEGESVQGEVAGWLIYFFSVTVWH